MMIERGGAGDDGWLTRSKDGASENLNATFIVCEGPFATKKFTQRFTLSGPTEGHETAKGITRNTMRAILESARGIKPNDKSESATAARRASSWAEFNNLRFIAKVGVEPASNGYSAKNKLETVITAELKDWKKVEQIQTAASPGATAPSPAGTIALPDWAK
jgi:hypothetical protein